MVNGIGEVSFIFSMVSIYGIVQVRNNTFYKHEQARLRGLLTIFNRKDHFGPNLGLKFFWRFQFYLMLDIVPICNLVQYQWKLMTQPWENGKNPNFKPNLGPQNFFSRVLPLLIVRQCSKLSSYAISRKINEPNLKKWQKT